VYNSDGQYVATVPSQTTNVILRAGTTDTNLGSIGNFNSIVSAVYGESSGDAQESRAIADVIKNRGSATQGVYGNNANSAAAASTASTSNTNANLVTARAAVIGSMTSSVDTSNGAYFWDGADITTNSHNSWGFVYSDSAHDIYNTGNVLTAPVVTHWVNANGTQGAVRGTYDHKLVSTAAFGGTIFWKYDSAFRSATGNRAYP